MHYCFLLYLFCSSCFFFNLRSHLHCVQYMIIVVITQGISYKNLLNTTSPINLIDNFCRFYGYFYFWNILDKIMCLFIINCYMKYLHLDILYVSRPFLEFLSIQYSALMCSMEFYNYAKRDRKILLCFQHINFLLYISNIQPLLHRKVEPARRYTSDVVLNIVRLANAASSMA